MPPEQATGDWSLMLTKLVTYANQINALWEVGPLESGAEGLSAKIIRFALAELAKDSHDLRRN